MFSANFFLRFTLLLVTGVLLAACLYVFVLDYEAITASLFSAYNQPEKLAKFRAMLLTPQRFSLLRAMLVGVVVLAVAGTAWSWRRGPQLAAILQKGLQQIQCIGYSVLACWRATSRMEKMAVLGLFVAIWAAQWWIAFRLPFHVDERFTYLYFVSKGWLVSMAYYPGPNNHILFTLLCNVVDSFLYSPFQVMKVSALLVGGVLPVVFWIAMRAQFRAEVAWLATALFMTSGYVFYYTTQGRGYGLLMLFVLIAAYCALQITRSDTIRRRWYGWFAVSVVLGFYTVPIFLYPFSGIALYTTLVLLHGRSYRKVWLFMVTGIVAAAATFLLYLPIFLINGWTAVTGNSWVLPKPWAEFREALPAHLIELAGAVWSYDYVQLHWLTAGVVLFCLVLLVPMKGPVAYRRWAGLLLACLITVPVLIVVQRILPYSRVITYMAIFLYPVVAIGLVEVTNKIVQTKLLRQLIILMVGGVLYVTTISRFTAPRDFDLYDSLDGVAAFLYQQRADSIFVKYYEYSLCIRLQYETNGRSIHLDTNNPHVGFPYQYVVVHQSHVFPPELPADRYRKVYQDPEATIFQRTLDSR